MIAAGKEDGSQEWDPHKLRRELGASPSLAPVVQPKEWGSSVNQTVYREQSHRWSSEDWSHCRTGAW